MINNNNNNNNNNNIFLLAPLEAKLALEVPENVTKVNVEELARPPHLNPANRTSDYENILEV
jgi:hypothetical protein